MRGPDFILWDLDLVPWKFAFSNLFFFSGQMFLSFLFSPVVVTFDFPGSQDKR